MTTIGIEMPIDDDWEVSNVNKAISGGNQSYTNRMYLIRIRHLSSGTPTGREWLLNFNGPYNIPSSDYRAYLAQTWDDTSVYSTYWQIGRDSSTARHGFWGLWYHKGGNLTRTDNSQPNTFALDYTSGDLAAPTVPTNGNFYNGNSPTASDWALFFPHFATRSWPKGIMITPYTNTLGMKFQQVMLFNHDKPFVGFYQSDSQGYQLQNRIIAGDIIVPRDPSDTFTEGVHHARSEPNNYAWILDGLYTTTLNSAGAQISYLDSTSFVNHQGIHADYSWTNQPDGSGNWDWNPVQIINTSAFKGYLDPDIVREQGPYGGGSNESHRWLGFQGGAGPMFGDINNAPLVYVWCNNLPVPFSGYPLDPMDVQKS
jgi:hypothetical protein